MKTAIAIAQLVVSVVCCVAVWWLFVVSYRDLRRMQATLEMERVVNPAQGVDACDETFPDQEVAHSASNVHVETSR